VAKVTRAALNANAYPHEMLTKIPVGTIVQDRCSQPSRRYILLKEGRRREITPEDGKYGSPTYDECLDSEPGKAIPKHFIAIFEAVSPIGKADAQTRDAMLAELRDYLVAHRTLLRHVELAQRTVRRLSQSAEPKAAIRMCHDFAGISDIYRRALLPMAEQLGGDLRRQRLLDNTMQLTGTTVDRVVFDWESYRGKVVLVDFWHTGCQPCLAEMPRILELYERHHETGFDVVGVSSDANRDDLTPYLTKAKIPWETIHEPWGTPNSNVSRYNITAFPTCILVDRDGKVLSLEANAERLEELLRKHLPPD
jgi:thiol-disulfide isomerase/thioredoxin